MSETELGAQALEELLEVAAKLKESGLLDMMKALVERYEDLMTNMAQDRRLFHAFALLEGALDGLEEGDPSKLKWGMMGLTSCLSKGMEEVTEGEVEPVGLLGLLKALREPEVMYGLGVLLTFARALGRCMMEKRNTGA